ncbi:unnamed protein product [Phytomonas sp. EM1]|nr:unnamed protein product [Phytomonas sp. EM1]|eukprot:CCW62435.1 unnamed protein product [Phytomonas sp. isolate EM1]
MSDRKNFQPSLILHCYCLSSIHCHCDKTRKTCIVSLDPLNGLCFPARVRLLVDTPEKKNYTCLRSFTPVLTKYLFKGGSASCKYV